MVFVIERNEHKGDEEIAYDITQDELKKVKIVVAHHPGNGDKGDSRQGSSNHSKGDQKPGRFSVSRKKRLVTYFS